MNDLFWVQDFHSEGFFGKNTVAGIFITKLPRDSIVLELLTIRSLKKEAQSTISVH